MAIVETKIVIRPNASIPFYNQPKEIPVEDRSWNYQARLDLIENLATTLGTQTVVSDTDTYYKSTNPSGSYVMERSYSSDLLTQTSKTTFDSLATWSTVETYTGIDIDRAYSLYAEASGLTHPSTGQYSLTGIDSAFTCTTTYTYPSNILDTYPLFESFVDVIESSDKLTSFTNTGTQLIAVHTYANSADFTNDYWRDFMFVASLYNSGVTRTISYAMV